MPEELCQVSPKSHYGVLASHSDPSPYIEMTMTVANTQLEQALQDWFAKDAINCYCQIRLCTLGAAFSATIDEFTLLQCKSQVSQLVPKGWGQSVKLGPHSAIWGKLGTALQAYALNPCTKFPPNPTSRKVNT